VRLCRFAGAIGSDNGIVAESPPSPLRCDIARSFSERESGENNMLMKTLFLAATAAIAASAGVANAATYNIQIDGACDYLSLTVSQGIVVGVSSATDCDDGNMIGYTAKLSRKVLSGAKVLIASSDLGSAPYSWSWAFDLSAGTAQLTGTGDGSGTLVGNFTFTYTKGGASHRQASNGRPTAISMTRKVSH
jgi:hypothetical protein